MADKSKFNGHLQQNLNFKVIYSSVTACINDLKGTVTFYFFKQNVF